ncbi:hypothetical protein Syun_017254 [Stephania yunnanensis]|uniref:GDSL esterase/lipase n=1 Tax=Stephania yunnanensis TaxID=152371 RepID=A0AAP0J670_9MAGN
MGFSSVQLFTKSLIFLVVASHVAHGQLVPGLCIFGDSISDVGNNDYLSTLIKADFLPYGRDFVTHSPTGRFCNGKLAIDFTAENLGFQSYPLPYLSPKAQGTNLLTGANFASAGSGYYDLTSKLYGAISLSEQLNYYKKYQGDLGEVAGTLQAQNITSGSIFLLSTGSSDFLQNYYIDPLVRAAFSIDQFSDILMRSFATFVQNLYKLGARRIGVTNLPPLGCLPAAITMFGAGSNECVKYLNQDAAIFNKKLNATAQKLKCQLPGVKIVVFDIYQPLLNLVMKPSQSGFFETRKACCGTGTIETSLFCNSMSIGTCANATEYVFWDGVHPSESANKIIATDLMSQGIDLIS